MLPSLPLLPNSPVFLISILSFKFLLISSMSKTDRHHHHHHPPISSWHHNPPSVSANSGSWAPTRPVNSGRSPDANWNLHVGHSEVHCTTVPPFLIPTPCFQFLLSVSKKVFGGARWHTGKTGCSGRPTTRECSSFTSRPPWVCHAYASACPWSRAGRGWECITARRPCWGADFLSPSLSFMEAINE